MFTSSRKNDDLLVEIEKVVNGSKGRPFLLGRVVSGSLELTARDEVVVHGDSMGWVFTRIEKVDRVGEAGEIVKESTAAAKPGDRISISLLGDPVTTKSLGENLQIGNSMPEQLRAEPREQRQPVKLQPAGLVVSGCMIGTALFLLFFMVVLGMPELGVMALIIDMVLVAILIGGVIIFFKPIVMRLQLARHQAVTAGRVVDRWLGILKNSDGEVNKTFRTLIEFNARQKDGATKIILLSIDGRHNYERFGLGSPIQVRYALNDPRMAQVEGEYSA